MEFNNNRLRSGCNTGPLIMLIADMAIYTGILTTMGKIFLALTTNLNIKFLKHPKSYKNLLGVSTLMNIGEKLIVGEVKIHLKRISEPVINSTCTYPIPPKSNQ